MSIDLFFKFLLWYLYCEYLYIFVVNCMVILIDRYVLVKCLVKWLFKIFD